MMKSRPPGRASRRRGGVELSPAAVALLVALAAFGYFMYATLRSVVFHNLPREEGEGGAFAQPARAVPERLSGSDSFAGKTGKGSTGEGVWSALMEGGHVASREGSPESGEQAPLGRNEARKSVLRSRLAAEVERLRNQHIPPELKHIPPELKQALKELEAAYASRDSTEIHRVMTHASELFQQLRAKRGDGGTDNPAVISAMDNLSGDPTAKFDGEGAEQASGGAGRAGDDRWRARLDGGDSSMARAVVRGKGSRNFPEVLEIRDALKKLRATYGANSPEMLGLKKQSKSLFLLLRDQHDLGDGGGRREDNPEVAAAIDALWKEIRSLEAHPTHPDFIEGGAGEHDLQVAAGGGSRGSPVAGRTEIGGEGEGLPPGVLGKLGVGRHKRHPEEGKSHVTSVRVDRPQIDPHMEKSIVDRPQIDPHMAKSIVDRPQFDPHMAKSIADDRHIAEAVKNIAGKELGRWENLGSYHGHDSEIIGEKSVLVDAKYLAEHAEDIAALKHAGGGEPHAPRPHAKARWLDENGQDNGWRPEVVLGRREGSGVDGHAGPSSGDGGKTWHGHNGGDDHAKSSKVSLDSLGSGGHIGATADDLIGESEWKGKEGFLGSDHVADHVTHRHHHPRQEPRRGFPDEHRDMTGMERLKADNQRIRDNHFEVDGSFQEYEREVYPPGADEINTKEGTMYILNGGEIEGPISRRKYKKFLAELAVAKGIVLHSEWDAPRIYDGDKGLEPPKDFEAERERIREEIAQKQAWVNAHTLPKEDPILGPHFDPSKGSQYSKWLHDLKEKEDHREHPYDYLSKEQKRSTERGQVVVGHEIVLTYDGHKKIVPKILDENGKVARYDRDSLPWHRMDKFMAMEKEMTKSSPLEHSKTHGTTAAMGQHFFDSKHSEIFREIALRDPDETEKVKKNKNHDGFWGESVDPKFWEHHQAEMQSKNWVKEYKNKFAQTVQQQGGLNHQRDFYHSKQGFHDAAYNARGARDATANAHAKMRPRGGEAIPAKSYMKTTVNYKGFNKARPQQQEYGQLQMM